jgi:hypothetical protein
MPADLKFVPGAPTVVIPSGPATPPPDGQSITITPSTPLITAPMPSGHPLVGSGGVVYPAGGPAPGMPFQAVPAVSGQAGVPLALYTPAAVGQQTILLVNGPNGPQYVIAEVLGSALAPVPTMALPSSAPIMPATTAMPASAMPPNVPATFAACPDQPPVPTFNPPPPATIPMPAMPSMPAPAVVPVAMGVKAPDVLSPAAGAKPPTGPVLPPLSASGPSLGSFPAPPAPGPFRAAKLPAATGVTDDEIPAAPAFVPAAK